MEDENLEKSWTNCRIPFSILNSPGTGTMAVNDRRYGPVRTGYMWRSMTAATGRCEREGRAAMASDARRCGAVRTGGERRAVPAAAAHRESDQSGPRAKEREPEHKVGRKAGPPGGPGLLLRIRSLAGSPGALEAGRTRLPESGKFFCRSVNLFALFSVL